MSSNERFLVFSLIFTVLAVMYLKYGIERWQNLGEKENLLEKLVDAPGVIVVIAGGVIGVVMFLFLTGAAIWEILVESF